ncbi:hypothetical protein JG687_00013560 [Phytophthora cactorum]|uniref:Uncharacterized protein n=1 Tax=Phytophthora cactorum TaxID=29920 RepID=A0A8T1TYL8_9STRA|nr:hypothetical protein PC120_g3958 [Phytophthora cactorum]KAG4048534.1 hypothetical protein PC123_g16152 [Phytophthora cactorum]KAG6951512.1 hypothetical protein JG687_00013560 [Phytophthora cactorum]
MFLSQTDWGYDALTTIVKNIVLQYVQVELCAHRQQFLLLAAASTSKENTNSFSMEPLDESAINQSTRLVDSLSAAAFPPFTVPMPLVWSDLVATRTMHVPPSPQPTPPPTNYAPGVGEVAPAAPDARKSKWHAKRQSGGQSKGQGKGQSTRIKWANKMVGELLHLRFSDRHVKRWLESADTKIKKALAWQYFAIVLSESFGMVPHHDQISLKYRKLKCVYRKEKRELKKTGNSVRVSEMDDGLWTILSDAFGGRVDISGEVLLDSAVDEDEDEEVGSASSKDDGTPTQKHARVAQLAAALQGGMEAIAASLGSRLSSEDQMRSLTASLQQQHEETRRFQEMQLQLLRELLVQRYD